MQALQRISSVIAPWARTMLDIVYPRACKICDRPLSNQESPDRLPHWICTACVPALTKLEPPFCKTCGEAFDGAGEGELRCSNCADRKFAFEFAIAGYRAEDDVRELVHRFKYGRDLVLRAPLGCMLQHALSDPRLATQDLARWLLVPVPLHPRRQREREFNQSWELCRELAKRTGIPAVEAMKRTRFTEKQAQLTRAQRLENLRGAFAMRRRYVWENSPLRGAKVLLVDDVFTTGATTHECARILKREGKVEKVVVISVARG